MQLFVEISDKALYLYRKLNAMKTTIEQQIKSLQDAWKKGETGMSVNEYTCILHQLYKKLK